MAGRNTLDMTQGPVAKKLFAFAMPVLVTLILQQLYNVADKAVVGQFAVNGKNALAAIGATASLAALVATMSTGLASGANVRCANLRGAGDMKTLRKSMHTAVLLAAVVGVALGALGICVARLILKLLDTPGEILGDSLLYIRIYFAGLPATVVYNFGAAILRAHGDSKRPMYILLCTGAVNVILNLILVLVFKLRVEGVAIATAVAQLISATWVMRILFGKKDIYKLTFRELRFHGESIKWIAKVGVPNGINGILFSMSNLVLQASINSFHDTAILAGKTASTDACNLLYQVLHAFALACVSFSGQCAGAKKYKRIDKLAFTATVCCIAVVSAASCLMTLFPGAVISIFNNDPAVIKAGSNILIINSWSYVLYAVSDMYLSCIRGMGKSMGSTIVNIAGLLVPRLLWIWLAFPMCRTVEFLYLCYPISFLISAVAQFGYFKYVRKKADERLALEAR